MRSKVVEAPKMAGLSAQEREIINSLAASEKPAITADDLISIHPVSRVTANQILSRLYRKAWLRRITRGIYTLVPLGASSPEQPIEDVWPLAMDLFAPCYISGWSAAEHWELTEQIFNSVAIVTTRPQRQVETLLAGVNFRIRIVESDKIFGAKSIWVGSQRVDVADPHRLIIDILDDPSFGGGGRHTLDIVRAYWKSKHAERNRLLDYAVRYNRGSVFKRLGFTAEKFGSVESSWLDKCREGVSAGISKLDPAGSNRGNIVSRWNLRINIPIDES